MISILPSGWVLHIDFLIMETISMTRLTQKSLEHKTILKLRN